MKILKKAEQKNVLVNNYYYTVETLNQLLREKAIWYFDKNYEVCYDEVDYFNYKDKQYRVFTEKLDRIVVELDECNSYTTVAYYKFNVILNGNKIYVEL